MEMPSLPRGAGEVVLLVEDDAPLRRMAAIQLRSFGYNVLEAADDQGAFRILESEQDIDLLLTDVVMPGGMNGAELGRRARELRPDLKLLYMSGFPRTSLEHGDTSEGVSLLLKPFRLRELAISLRKALDGRS